jgi:alkylhydroperoxidase/carboxymuconolactone decarboxylase family protein YurZ
MDDGVTQLDVAYALIGLARSALTLTAEGQAMTIKNKVSAFVAAAVVTIALVAAGTLALAGGIGARASEPRNTVAATPQSATPSVLTTLRTACPLLADIVEEFALLDLGEAFPSEGAKLRSDDIIAVAALAKSGDIDAMKRVATQALAAGATKREFEKALYLTAVNAGVPKAIEATRALSELLTDQQSRCSAATLPAS